MRSYINKKYYLIIPIILGLNLIIFLFTFSAFIISPQNKNGAIAKAQENLICPTGTSTQDAIQLLHCYINTPTPTIPLSPSPTITPVPISSPSTTPSAAVDPCSPQFTDYSAVKQAISDKYKIDLQGDADIQWGAQAFTTMCQLYKSNLFVSLLGQNPITVRFSGNACGNISGHADMNTGITISGMCNSYINRAVLVHELAHMIQFRSPNIFNNFLNSVWPATIPTYNCQVHYTDQAATPPECFTDGIAEYVVYPNYRFAFDGQPPGPINFPAYPTQHANYYNFFRDNVFGGITF